MAVVIQHLPDDSPAGELAHRAIVAALADGQACVAIARSRKAVLPTPIRAPMLVVVHGGSVIFDFPNRSLAVDDDGYLLVDAAQYMRAHIEPTDAQRGVACAQIYWPPAFLEPIVDVSRWPLRERVIRNDKRVSPVVRYIVRCVQEGGASLEWLDEQLRYLAHRLALAGERQGHLLASIQRARADTRLMLFRRVSLAADYIDSHYDRTFGLRELAQVACLSRFQLLRVFKQVYGVTPQSYKEQKRVLVARRLLAASELSQAVVAARVGYSTSTSLRMQLRRWGESSQAAGATSEPVGMQSAALALQQCSGLSC